MKQLFCEPVFISINLICFTLSISLSLSYFQRRKAHVSNYVPQTSKKATQTLTSNNANNANKADNAKNADSPYLQLRLSWIGATMMSNKYKGFPNLKSKLID